MAKQPRDAQDFTKRALNRLLETQWIATWDADSALEALSALSAEHRSFIERYAGR